MKELEKINKVIGKIIPNAPHETLLVIDATTGQNGIMQAKACAHQRTKSCKATLCSVSEKLYYLCSFLYLDTSFWILSYGFNRSLMDES